MNRKVVLEEIFKQIIEEEIGADGYVKITNIITRPEQITITIKGVFGEKVDGEIDWEEDFKLHCDINKSFDFIQGMFYRVVQDVLYW